jgi:prevent-host-death family protein
MPVTTLSSRELHQDAGRAKRAAKKGPVFITDRGRPTHVLLTFDEYQKIAGPRRSIGDMLSDPAAAEIEFDPPRLGFIAREVDFS